MEGHVALAKMMKVNEMAMYVIEMNDEIYMKITEIKWVTIMAFAKYEYEAQKG